MPLFKIIASQIGNDAGPFTIKNNLGQVIATGVTRAQLLNGYIFNVANGITSVTVESTGACTNSTSFTIPNVGFWEMEKNNVEEVSDHYGAIQTNYVVPVETFVGDDIVGIYIGIMSGTGTWLIKGTAEAISGTTYNPGGTLIVTNANTNSATTVEGGAILQVGYDLDAVTGRFNGTVTNQVGGIINVVGADEPNGRAVFSTLVNNGNVNITGKDACGEGYFTTASLDNRSLVTLEDSVYRPAAYGTGVGTILVKDGATIEAANTGIPSTQTLQLNGCGKCNEIGMLEGALLHGVVASTIASPIVLQSETCFKNLGTQTTFSGQLTGNFKLKLNNYLESSTASGSHTFTSNLTPYFDNTIEVKNTSLYNTGTNTLSKADIVLVENGRIQQDGGIVNFGSLSSTSSTSTILANSSVSVNIKENGETTYAGILQNSTPGTPWNFRLDGPSTNKITLTGGGGSATNLISADGSKIVAQTGTYNQWSSVNGGTISAGTAISTRINTLTISALGAIDVYKSGNSCGLIWAANAANLTAGWKVNVMENLAAGTYNILQKPNAVALTLPVIGTNASGLTATFANVGNFITMTLS